MLFLWIAPLFLFSIPFFLLCSLGERRLFSIMVMLACSAILYINHELTHDMGNANGLAVAFALFFFNAAAAGAIFGAAARCSLFVFDWEASSHNGKKSIAICYLIPCFWHAATLIGMNFSPGALIFW
ncbi:MAG: hypothetical protein EKK49_11800 [Rhodocyclaceae bacterium]|jgi:hypothetical protein|nr:MAG: hypothetical protein EKK49_11800 [Rhodocyclaceae bacterium]